MFNFLFKIFAWALTFSMFFGVLAILIEGFIKAFKDK